VKFSELMIKLQHLAAQGVDGDVLFDSEAMAFSVHLVEVTGAHWETDFPGHEGGCLVLTTPHAFPSTPSREECKR
jgi:hypothetical protein